MLAAQGSLAGGFHNRRVPERDTLSQTMKAVHVQPSSFKVCTVHQLTELQNCCQKETFLCILHSSDKLEVWCSLLSAVFAQIVLDLCVNGTSKQEKVAPSLATHLMARGLCTNSVPKTLSVLIFLLVGNRL